jgi:glycosyltransferase involved in cell wall biosynthesis
MVTPLWKRAAVKRLAYRSLDLAVTMTRANASFLSAWQGAPASRVRVVPNGIARSFGEDPVPGRSRRWALGLRDRDVVVGYIGNILPHKGLRRLIEAVSRSVHRDTFYLLVVGSGPDEAACRQLALDRNLSHRINFLGWQSHEEAEEILGACDVLALPSSIEGLPYVVLEAMASRLPVLAGRVYGIPEVVEDGVTGILVDPGSVEEIAAALDRLAADSALRAAMGGAGRARFEREFTLERQARRMEQLYESLLRGGTDRGASA